MGDTLTRSNDIDLPDTIGVYTIHGILGRGGMGIVYRAQHPESGEWVALKTVSAHTGTRLNSIRREIHALSRLSHPGVVRILDQGTWQGLPWYAMELLRGRTLRDSLCFDHQATQASNSIPATQALSENTQTLRESGEMAAFAPQCSAPARLSKEYEPAAGQIKELARTILRICTPLAYLHGSGLVHRDLKPENIFIRPDGMPVLMDLGIAIPWSGPENREDINSIGIEGGTPYYMAPEQLRGEFVDARADLYALGCILYECICGHPPFLGNSIGALMHMHLNIAPTPPSTLRPGIPQELDRIVLSLLEKQPRDRAGYAEDVASALSECLDIERDSAPPISSSPYLYRPQFVGREDIFSALSSALDKTIEMDTGSIILLSGESGAGKTRLAMELAQTAQRGTYRVITGQCLPLGIGGTHHKNEGASPPLQVFRSFLGAFASFLSERPYWIPSFIDRILWLIPYEPKLEEFIDSETTLPEPVKGALSPELSRLRVFEALAFALRRYAEQHPLLLVLDDLQWADELSLSALLHMASEGFSRTPALILGTYRADFGRPALDSLSAREGIQNFCLKRMEREQIQSMVCGMLSIRTPPPALIDFLERNGGGNPFFIGEYLRAAVSEGLLARAPSGHFKIQADMNPMGIENLPLPQSVQHLMENRLSSLDEQSLALLRLAAIMGREIPTDAFVDAAELYSIDYNDNAIQLKRRHLLEEGQNGRLRFTHDRIREGVYSSMAGDQKRRLHGIAAASLERHFGQSPDEFPVLAHHFAQACVHDKAGGYYARSAERARNAYAHTDAIALYRHAAAEFDRLETADGLEALRGVYRDLADTLAHVGFQEEARKAYLKAISFSSNASPIEKAELHRKLGRSFETHHEHKQALSAYAEAEKALGNSSRDLSNWERAPDALFHEWMQIQIDRISVHYWLAQVEAMQSIIAQVKPLVQKRGLPQHQAQFFRALVQVQLRLERYMPSLNTIEYARAWVRASAEGGSTANCIDAKNSLGTVLLWQGAILEAQPIFESLLKELDKNGEITLKSRCLTYLTMVFRRRRDTERVRELSQRSLSAAQAAGMNDYIGAAKANLAWTAWMDGGIGDALRLGEEAMAQWQGLSLVYPFQWLARFPFIAAALAADRAAAALPHLPLLLNLNQQRLPDPLAAAIENAIQSGAGHSARAFKEVKKQINQMLRMAEQFAFI